MHTLTIEVTGQDALKTLHILEEKHLIRIIDDYSPDSPALSGSPLNLKTFKDWIANAEEAPTISLSAAKKQWESKRKTLVELTR